MAFIYTPLKINGVISTEKTVFQNLNDICTAAGAFLSYDVAQGKWAVIINKPGTSVASFDDSNIIGSVSISETGVSELYNSVSLEFPHKSLKDDIDYVDLEIDTADRYPNEIDNTLNIKSDLINDPVQAQYLAGIELKQSRLSKIVTFRTDYTSLGLKAGELIDLTSNVYGFTNKIFRIISLEETDEDVIGVQITALEYSEDIYDDTGLVARERSKQTGILLKEQNTTLRTKDDVDVGNQLTRLLAANLGAALLKKLFSRLAGTETFGPENQAAEDIDKLLSNAKRPTLTSITMPDTICEGGSITITIGHACSSCFFNNPEYEYDWEITGVFEEDIISITVNGTELDEVSLTGTVAITTSGTIVIETASTAGSTSSQTLTITCGGLTDSTIIYDVLDTTFSTTAASGTITEGESVVVTVTTTNVANGTLIPYTITGSATGKVTSPALTGNITINSNTATVTIVTNDDGVYQGTQNLTFTISPDVPSNPCHGTWDFTAPITVLDNETAPPPDTTCLYVQVPVVWCALYDGTDEQMKSYSVRQYAYLPIAQAGEATVSLPTSLTVTKGNPSTISVGTTVAVASSSSLGGVPIQVITSFNSVAPKGLITGTTTTVYGYLV